MVDILVQEIEVDVVDTQTQFISINFTGTRALKFFMVLLHYGRLVEVFDTVTK